MAESIGSIHVSKGKDPKVYRKTETDEDEVFDPETAEFVARRERVYHKIMRK
ncbi:MAG: hypothetical protein V1827_02010 [Candidatus Micrarchaeota archaeon]